MALNVWQAATKQRLQEVVGSDPQVRASMPLPDVAAAVREPGRSLAGIVDAVMLGYADRPAVGERPRPHGTDGSDPATFEVLTYAELWARARALATVWSEDADGPRPGDLVCSLGAGSCAYATLELACIAAGVVSVPLTPTANRADRAALLAETCPSVVALDLAQLADTIEALMTIDGPGPRLIVVLDWPSADLQAHRAVREARTRLSVAGRSALIESLGDQIGRGVGRTPVPLATDRDPEALTQIIYTSGATGTPKGAMFGARHLAALWIGQAQSQMPAIVTHYMPMSHTAGRMVLTGALARGGTCYFSTGSDPARMWADVAATRPTEFFLIPRLCEMIRDRYRTTVRGLLGIGLEPAAAEARARDEARTALLGGRVLAAVNGSAPLDPELRALLAEILQVPVHDAYGSTEAGGVVLFNNLIQRPPVLEYKLSDVPELGYFATDQPHPRGELLVKTLSMVPGYYRRPELSADMFDDEGYYRTGDVMAQTGVDELSFVERRNNTLKLSQAEFVAVATLESIFATSPHIDQIFIYGRNGRPDLLAVVVPSAESAARLSGPELRTAIADSLRDLAKEHDLRPYEIPRDFVVEPVGFSAENGLATGLSKPIRHRLVQHYGPGLERLYRDLDDAQADEFAGLREGAAERPILETVTLAAQALVGSGTSLPAQATFAELGGDSMSAYELSSRLTEIFQLEVPSSVILSPANNLVMVADFIETERRSGGRRPTARTVHAEPGRLRADELTLEAFLDPDTLEAAGSLGAGGGTESVLLTGANGYLGRFVLLELLRRVENGPGTVICLVRAVNDQAARQRLDEAFDSGDPDLVSTYRALAQGRLEVLAADVSRPDLGLREDDWNRLAIEVDEIVHPAATVNHVLPYEELFGPNVAGTAELIRLAITDHLKTVVYLSTVGVADQILPGQFDETSDIRRTCPQRVVRDEYANGYANTKWASEVLLRDAHERFGLPVTVFRSNLLLAHRHYRGQLNVPDMLTRLLLSMALTGIAPASFYRPGPDGSRKRVHFDGLPVDFVAEAVVHIRADGPELATYNLVNPHTGDGVSLDTFVDWLAERDPRTTRLPDYAEWLRRLEIGLRGLPNHLRQRSLLPLIHAFAEPEMLPDLAVPAEEFQDAVRWHHIGGGHVPSIDRALIEKYVDDLRALGLLESAVDRIPLDEEDLDRELVDATSRR